MGKEYVFVKVTKPGKGYLVSPFRDGLFAKAIKGALSYLWQQLQAEDSTNIEVIEDHDFNHEKREFSKKAKTLYKVAKF